MQRVKVSLEKILVETGKLNQAQMDKVMASQEKTGRPLRNVLLDDGYIGEDDLLGALAFHLRIPCMDPSQFEVHPQLLNLVPEQMMKKYKFFPLYRISDTLLIAVSEVLDIITLDNLHHSLGGNIRQVLAREKRILECIDSLSSRRLGGARDVPGDESLQIIREKKSDDLEQDDLKEESAKEPIVQAVNRMINEAVAGRASDIHIEPGEEDVQVRFRIDGILHSMYTLPKKIQRGVAARIKILSNMDITRYYVPQDGRFSFTSLGRPIDFRVSSLPTIYGEKFVLRILDKSAAMVRLADLGFSEQPLALLKEAIQKDHGMILITGPTGSGKSTTLYSILTELNTVNRHIVTIEEPVEYQLEGIGQTQIRTDIDFTFAAALRGLLRQTPDIIMVGEIRDTETADIATKASLIGQVIFSTLHTNDSVSAFARLIDMGVERYLVASSLILVCAQRLCRKICTKCKEAAPLEGLSDYMRAELGACTNEEIKLYRGRGCEECHRTGYKGRVAILEALRVDDTVKNMIIKEVPFQKVSDYVINEKGLITLRKDGLHKALAGITTIEEIYRVTAKD